MLLLQMLRMAFFMEEDVALYPLYVSFLDTDTLMAHADSVTHVIQQARRLGADISHDRHYHWL